MLSPATIYSLIFKGIETVSYLRACYFMVMVLRLYLSKLQSNHCSTPFKSIDFANVSESLFYQDFLGKGKCIDMMYFFVLYRKIPKMWPLKIFPPLLQFSTIIGHFR